MGVTRKLSVTPIFGCRYKTYNEILLIIKPSNNVKYRYKKNFRSNCDHQQLLESSISSLFSISLILLLILLINKNKKKEKNLYPSA